MANVFDVLWDQNNAMFSCEGCSLFLAQTNTHANKTCGKWRRTKHVNSNFPTSHILTPLSRPKMFQRRCQHNIFDAGEICPCKNKEQKHFFVTNERTDKLIFQQTPSPNNSNSPAALSIEPTCHPCLFSSGHSQVPIRSAERQEIGMLKKNRNFLVKK